MKKRNAVATLLMLMAVFVFTEVPGGFREITSKDDADLKRLAEHIKLTSSYEADFVQERHLALFKDVLKSTGKIYFEVPDKLRWEITDPYVSLLVSSNGQVARFTSEENRLKKMDLGNQEMFQQIIQEMTGIMRGDFQALFSQYRILLSQSMNHLMLLPRSKDLQKSIASLEFSIESDSGKVTQVIIREPEKDFVQIQFQNTKENVKLDPAIFSLQAPTPPTR